MNEDDNDERKGEMMIINVVVGIYGRILFLVFFFFE